MCDGDVTSGDSSAIVRCRNVDILPVDDGRMFCLVGSLKTSVQVGWGPMSFESVSTSRLKCSFGGFLVA